MKYRPIVLTLQGCDGRRGVMNIGSYKVGCLCFHADGSLDLGCIISSNKLVALSVNCKI